MTERTLVASTVTAAEAAKVLGVSSSRVRKLVSEGALPNTAPAGSALRIPREAVDDHLRKRAEEPARAAVKVLPLEALLDRVLVKRLRPLRDDAKAVRQSLDQQVERRVQAELRAATAEKSEAALQRRVDELEDAAGALRVRIAELEQALAQERERPVGIFRRRRRLAEG